MRINPRQALLASTIFAFAALGATGASAAANDAAAPAMPGHGPVGDPSMNAMHQRLESRITELHSSLHITAAQQPQWDAFVAVMRNNAQNMDNVLVTDSGALPKMTAVEQMQSYAKITDQHAKDMASLLPAFQGLYDVMSPEQKLNADKYFRAQAERSRHAKNGKKA